MPEERWWLYWTKGLKYRALCRRKRGRPQRAFIQRVGVTEEDAVDKVGWMLWWPSWKKKRSWSCFLVRIMKLVFWLYGVQLLPSFKAYCWNNVRRAEQLTMGDYKNINSPSTASMHAHHSASADPVSSYQTSNSSKEMINFRNKFRWQNLIK